MKLFNLKDFIFIKKNEICVDEICVDEIFKNLPHNSNFKVSNPFFLIDMFAHTGAICKVTSNISLAKEFLQRSMPNFASNEFSNELYLQIRKISIDSRFRLNKILRKYYRNKFDMTTCLNLNEKKVLSELNNEGYKVFQPTQKSISLCLDTLGKLNSANVVREKDGKIGKLNELKGEKLSGSFRYWYLEEDLPITETIHLLDEMGILDLIRAYLGDPILRCANAWHSTALENFTNEDEKNAAQKYHTDNDNPSGWVKVFIYLTDVGENQGPHVFVPRSHIELPETLKRDGRFEDHEIHKIYGDGVMIKGGVGTIIIADTQGFHKGLTVKDGDRSILQLEFTNSLFGALTPKFLNSRKIIDDLNIYGNRFLLRYQRDVEH